MGVPVPLVYLPPEFSGLPENSKSGPVYCRSVTAAGPDAGPPASEILEFVAEAFTIPTGRYRRRRDKRTYSFSTLRVSPAPPGQGKSERVQGNNSNSSLKSGFNIGVLPLNKFLSKPLYFIETGRWSAVKKTALFGIMKRFNDECRVHCGHIVSILLFFLRHKTLSAYYTYR